MDLTPRVGNLEYPAAISTFKGEKVRRRVIPHPKM